MDIRSLGIKELRSRKVLMLKVPGAEGAAKADALARELQAALQDRESVRISRPIKTSEIRIKDLEDSVTSAEIAEAVANEGECQTTDVRVGPIRQGINRLDTVWVRGPMVAANRLLRKGNLKIGWTKVRIEHFPERPVTCFSPKRVM